MSSLKVKEDVTEFNWDDINVGNNLLDHSENFFGKQRDDDS